MVSTSEVADFFLFIQDEEDRIEHLKLQKLCYYAQGLHLAIFGEPLFSESLMAWQHGPVVQSIWRKYRYTNAQPLPRPQSYEPARLPRGKAAFLRRVYEEYGQYSAWKLREMTHAERPWREAKQTQRQVLSNETMRQFFRETLLRKVGERPRLTRDQVRDLVEHHPRISQAVAKGRVDVAEGRLERL